MLEPAVVRRAANATVPCTSGVSHLVDGGVVDPGSTEARYEYLSGGPQERLMLYVARRHLGMSHTEWRAVPWWVRRVYYEGLIEEQLISESDEVPASWELDPIGASAAGFRTEGFTVIDGG